MGMPAARVGDWHECPKVDPGPIPHVGGPILPPCDPMVIIGGSPAARVGDQAKCVPTIDTIANGEYTVLIGGQPAARLGDKTVHMGTIMEGCYTVLIGHCKCEKTFQDAASAGVPFVQV
jgi:uncharacterized Zn-binding protein involved in type VI secretion